MDRERNQQFPQKRHGFEKSRKRVECFRDAGACQNDGTPSICGHLVAAKRKLVITREPIQPTNLCCEVFASTASLSDAEDHRLFLQIRQGRF